jgi:hypothetical protein
VNVIVVDIVVVGVLVVFVARRDVLVDVAVVVVGVDVVYVAVVIDNSWSSSWSLSLSWSTLRQSRRHRVFAFVRMVIVKDGVFVLTGSFLLTCSCTIPHHRKLLSVL